MELVGYKSVVTIIVIFMQSLTGKNLGYQLVEYETDILSQADIPGRMCGVGITVPYDVW